MEELIKIAILQLKAFKKFQEETYGEMTVKDFDVWLGGYVSGISHVYGPSIEKEEELVKKLDEIAMAIATSDVAKEIGVTGIEKQEFIITRENVCKE